MRVLTTLLIILGSFGCRADPAGIDATFHPISADGVPDSTIRLSGTLRLPTATPVARVPAVVLVHGLSADRSQFDFLADTLSTLGLATLAFDVRGHGASGGVFPITTPEHYSIAADDLRGALAWLRERGEIATNRIGTVGLSLGGGAVIAVAVEQDLPVVAWYPALAYLVRGDSLVHASLASTRVLIIHGTDDANLRSAPEFSARLADSNPQVGLIWAEGGGHGYGSHRSLYVSNTVDSLVTWLNSP